MNRNMCRKSSRWFSFLIGILMLFLLIGTPLQAADQKEGEGVFTLGEIEVSAKGEEVKNTTVEKITEQEMRQFNRDTVSSALNLLPGLTLSSFGARNEQMIYARGLDQKHVPIFLDGVPIYVPYDGYPDLSRYTTFNLSEIVVSKGFTSVLYGPNTMGGSINLVSKRPEKALEGDAGIGVFSGDGFRAYANLGTNQKLWYAQGGFSYLSSDYMKMSDGFDSTDTEDGNHRENSYYRDRNYNLKVGFTPADGHEYALSYYNQHGEKGTPPYAGSDSSQMIRYWQWPYWDMEGVHFNSRTPLGDKSYVKVRGYYDEYQNSLYSYDDDSYSTFNKKSSFRSQYDDETYGGSIEVGTSLIPRNLIKVAGHYKWDVHKEHNKPDPWQRFEERLLSIGVEDTITITDKLYAIVGLSYDNQDTVQAEDWNYADHRDFPDSDNEAWNPQAGLFYNFTDKRKVSFTISQKTRFPSIKDKYSYRLGKAIPNPDLEPEKATNYEAGYQDVLFERVALKTAVFYRHIKDYILSVTVDDPNNPGFTTSQNQNIGKVDQLGFEIELSAPITSTLDAGINYSYINNNNRSNDDLITNVPEHKVFAYAKYSPIKPLSFQADVESDSKRFSSTDGYRVASGYTVANVEASYEIVKGLVYEVGVKNLLDKDYALDEGYPMPGRTYFTNLTFRY
ncbi:MAG: Colicin I receptor precursor [Syntrophus sp. PtaU1.Bin208]|nr:MAG: Colicin I receptor precursor [Syntrophus sp. PtaU1.Bin208]